MKTSRALILLSVIASCVVSFSSLSEAATFTICSSGCDSTTIQGGINMASDYDTVQITDSLNYNETIVLNRSVNLSSNATTVPIVFTQNTTPTINVTASNASIYRLVIIYNGTSRFSAIESRSTFNITIYNNTIRTNGTGFASPIFVRSVNQSNFNSNIITSTSTGTNNVGINLTSSSSNNITFNIITISSTGSTSNFGISVYSGSNGNNIISNNVTGGGTGTGNGAIDLSVSNNNIISYNNLSATAGGGNSHTISIVSSSTGNVITNNFVRFALSNGGGRGISLTSSNNNTIENNTFSGSRISNGNIGLSATSSSNLTIRGNNITARGFFSGTTGISITSGSGSRIERNSVFTEGPGGAVPLTISTSNTNNVTDNNFTASAEAGGASYGISMSGTSSNRIERNNITTSGSNTDYGIRFTSTATNNNVSDSIINATLAADIRDENTAASRNFFLNSTFNNTDISFAANSVGRVFVQWRLNVIVTDNFSTPISGIRIFSNDTNDTVNTDNPTSNFTSVTNATGYISEQLITSYMANLTYNSSNAGIGYLNFNNNTIQIRNSSFNPFSLSYNISSNTNITITAIPTRVENHTISMSINDSVVTTITRYEPPATQSTTVTASDGSSNGYRESTVSSLDDGSLEVGIPYILPDAPKKINVTETDSHVVGLEISVRETVTSVKILISSNVGAPPKEVDARVYSYIEIEKENLNNEEIENVKIKFKVNRSWIRSNELNPEFVSLYRFSSNRWDRLSTTLMSVDKESYVYEAITPGFSTFAIAGRESDFGDLRIGNATIEKSAEKVVNTVVEAVKKPTESPLNMAITIIMFGVTIAIFYFAHHVKTRVREHIHKRNLEKTNTSNSS